MKSLESTLWGKRLLIKKRTPRLTRYWAVSGRILNTGRLKASEVREEVW